MRRALPLLLSLALAGVLTLFAAPSCGGDDDDSAVPDDDGDDDADDDGGDDVDTQPPGPPYVEEPTSPTYLDWARVQGIAEAGATVRVAGGAAETSTASDPATGAFCLLVALTPDATNELRVTAVDAAENESGATIVEVEQVAPSEDFNLALNHPASASSTSTGHPENVAARAVDGNLDTYWEASQNSLPANPQWLRVDLGEFRAIDGFEVHWNAGAHFATSYDLKVHPDDFADVAPSDPSWITVWGNDAGDGGDDAVVLAEPAVARHVGILLRRSSGGVPYNYYEIRELVVLGHETTLPQPCE